MVNSGVLFWLGIHRSQCMQHAFSPLDIYCLRSSLNQMDINEAVSKRNSLQVARPSTLELMTLVLQTTGFCTLLANAIVVQGNRPRCMALIPSFVLLLYLGYVFCMAASITDQYASGQLLMNLLQSSIEMDTEWLYVGQYVTCCAAGFLAWP